MNEEYSYIFYRFLNTSRKWKKNLPDASEIYHTYEMLISIFNLL